MGEYKNCKELRKEVRQEILNIVEETLQNECAIMGNNYSGREIAEEILFRTYDQLIEERKK